MKIFSTREAAKKLGITAATLSKYIAVEKVPAPKTVHLGVTRVHAWTEGEIEKVRKLLPKIANGRKTRYQKERAKKKSQSKGPKESGKKK
jgi:predicted DNA-binding transcriptional regulator AlpA